MANGNNEPRPKIDARIDGAKGMVDSQGEASTLYNKGSFGTPQTGGSLVLEPLETVYLVDVGRINLTDDSGRLSREEAMRWAMGEERGFEVKYLVYREIRNRGYVAKSAPDPIDFRVFPRGGKPNKTPSEYWLNATSERWPMVLKDLRELYGKASDVQKKLMIGVADEEGDITYYAISDRTLQGDRDPLNSMPKGVPAVLLEDRVMVFDQQKAEAIHRLGWYGQILGNGLQLSLIEAAYLLANGVLAISDSKTESPVPQDEFEKRAEDIQDVFSLRLSIYKDLRAKGLIVKTGFKYGSHFRAYDGDPENHHARFLIQAVPNTHESSWPVASGAVRLAHGVKKELILATPVDDGAIYTRIRRLTP